MMQNIIIKLLTLLLITTLALAQQEPIDCLVKPSQDEFYSDLSAESNNAKELWQFVSDIPLAATLVNHELIGITVCYN